MEQKKREMGKKEMDREREKMEREASWREMERDVQGYGMFGGSSMDVCGGPVLQRGGASRRINGRGAVAR